MAISKLFSIALQAVVGSYCKFLAIDGGTKKRVIVAFSVTRTVLKNLNLGHQILVRNSSKNPLKAYLIRPYPVFRLETSGAVFNKPLSKARQLVEWAFGTLCSKWRLLNKATDLSPTDTYKIVNCSCLLHNIIIYLFIN